ncbi:GtrA family protein [Actinomadura soli]|uniref:GtrA family protein n=1 Tax=Actinomadura soli TaxID=2508997 RepID=UPI001486ADE7|nr:GtrA family protein [Actinomadura soli]
MGTGPVRTVTFTCKRLKTWRDRARTGLAREYLLFFVFNVVGIAISLLVIRFVTMRSDERSPSYNAPVIGAGLATLFRFTCYQKWVFVSKQWAG